MNRKTGTMALLCSAFLVIGCSDGTTSTEDAMMDKGLSEDLELIQQRKVYFGHMSVGDNLMDGVQELATESDIPLNVVWLAEPGVPASPYFAHSKIANNRFPFDKCDVFSAYVDTLAADSVDVVMMKFCYVDFDQGDNPEEIFLYYQKTMEALRNRYPRIEFIHITTPVTTRQSGWKRFAKSLLGREDNADLYAYKRAVFNEFLLNEYQAEPLFDLAAIESSLPDGSQRSFVLDGKKVYTLRDDFTDDGGHLNKKGRKVVGRAFIRAIADVLRRGM